MKHEKYSAESRAISGGHDPSSAYNSIKPPIYQTSTFKFNTAEEGKAFFMNASGDIPLEERNASLIYTRLNHPNAITAEYRLAQLDGAEDAAFFESGMAAISTTILSFCQAGDLIVMSSPLYGGTDTFIKKHAVQMGIEWAEMERGATQKEVEQLLANHPKRDKLKMIYLETPANPTLTLVDIEMVRKLRDRLAPNAVIAVDNTYMGPLFQQPLAHGADINLYSATKYIGGHSDIIAGAASGSEKLMKLVKQKRAILGNTASPFTSWLLSRSMETIGLRMEKQASNAHKLAEYLAAHPKVKATYYLGLMPESDPQYALFKRQNNSGGAMIAFEVHGGEAEAFRFLNALELAHLAISLGSTETLVSHPYTMSSSNMDEADRLKNGITPSLIRVSVGIENIDDLVKDFDQALRTA
ncbi:aminotransferase class I/II-fold pyridoxal phosphate-dependent enzyme [Roseivirga sp. UBA1976]|uniref:trans-sulfuration enzyme family protein n=1 Tax=Roseivirga sp. UBA1976 TaxID=1947386 RepID=UPI00257F1415|nr:aminotransferase class I/II-fold pyridoxal phosphate-dependent enzyme [Roseivirga sp. UBA1976]|tara:strand:+ start:4952 stop:6190 length:1239 start_codon:yes stop_codon:yes gene_type:complete